jgi:23S rRNA (adenine2503-C2)-methyltransferase
MIVGWFWVQVLQKHGLSVSVRVTRGLDAAAACGQLRNVHQKTALAEFPRVE